MKLTVKNADLSKELNLLEKITDKKSALAVLSNVLIRANSGGTVVLSATDLQVGLIGACGADVTEDGAVTLPAKKLMEIVRAQSAPDITLESDAKGVVTFTSGGFKSRLQALPAADFPGIPPVAGSSLPLPRESLKQMLGHVRYAISDKDQRYFMKGVFIRFAVDELFLAATDSARISLSSAPRVGEDAGSVLVPDRAVDQLTALLAESALSDDILFTHGEKHLFFDVDGRLLISRQVDGKFPDVVKFLPKDNVHQVTVEREAFNSVLKRAVLIDEVVSLSLSQSVTGGTLDVSAASTEVGSGAESVPVEYAGPDMLLKFKGQFIIDFLSAASAQNVVLALKDAATPALFQDGAFQNVIMGMRAQ